jgi:hypothetical protein
MSIGGEEGEPAYLIPSFKYGQPLSNPLKEFKETGDYLGGPFKTWQEADKWEKEIRHPYVEKGQSIPSPLKWWGEGFQNGGELKYYQEGNDFKPKMIGQFGATLMPMNPLISKASQGDRTIELLDLRKKRATTNKPIVAKRDLVSGKYNAIPLEETIRMAKQRGLSEEDAWNLAAIGFQETKWGQTDEGGDIGHVTDGTSINPYDNMINAYKEKMATADRLKYTDPALRLQLYNGTGTITPKSDAGYHGYEMQSIYGVPIPKGGINMKKNPLYGKQILDLRDNVLKKNLEVQKLMNQYYEYGGTIKQDNNGYWNPDNWGKPVQINSNDITMEGVYEPLDAFAASGEHITMYPGNNYHFKKGPVVEVPTHQNWADKY